MFLPTESDTADFLKTAFPIMNYNTARFVGQIAFLPCLGNLRPIILVRIQEWLPRSYLPNRSKRVWYQNKRSKQVRCEKALNGWFLIRICGSVGQTLSKVHACEGNATQSSGIYSETDAKDRKRGYLSKPVHRILFLPCMCQQQNWTSKENEIGLACFQFSNQFRLTYSLVRRKKIRFSQHFQKFLPSEVVLAHAMQRTTMHCDNTPSPLFSKLHS